MARMRNRTRVKSEKEILPITDWQGADDIVRQIGDLQLQIKNHEAAANDIINEAKLQLSAATVPLAEKIMKLTESLEAFAANNVKDFGKSQSKKLNFGTIGWRKSTAILIKKTTLSLVHKVFGKNALLYLRFKEDVDREALKALTDEQLASLDARRENKEPFFVEPDLPKAVDYDGT